MAIGLWLFVPCVSGQTYVELDADGILGNGPDSVWATVGDTVRIEVYVQYDFEMIGGLLCYVRVSLCGDCAVLDSIRFWPGWGCSLVPADSCILLIGNDMVNFCDTHIFPPVHFTSIYYVVHGCPCWVQVDESDSYWIDSGGDYGVFSGSVPIHLCVGSPTGTAESSWGSVKALFR